MSNILERDGRDPLCGFTLETLTLALHQRLAGRVESAFLFGSAATGTLHPGSDVDLILVVSTDIPFLERPSLFPDLYRLGPALDLLVYTPDEFRRLTEDPSPGFWRTVVSEMKRIV